MAAILIDLRCTQQQQDRNHIAGILWKETANRAGPGLNPFGIRYRSSRPICNAVRLTAIRSKSLNASISGHSGAAFGIGLPMALAIIWVCS
jgi:hypothetical protein